MYAQIPKRFEKSSHTSVSSARPSVTVEPTGRCIQELALMMKNAESQEAEGEDPDRRQMDALREPIPAEDPEPEEGRLEHEGREPLDRERRSEHVPDELRVDRPVHPELELLDEPRRDADREVDEHQRAEEPRQTKPRDVARPVPQRLHDRDERGEPERERHEQEVVEGRRRELEACEVDRADSQGAHVARNRPTSRLSPLAARARTTGILRVSTAPNVLGVPRVSPG